MIKIVLIIFIVFLLFVLLAAGALYLYAKSVLRQESMGRAPSGTRLARVKQSPNYRSGAFQNQGTSAKANQSASSWATFKTFLTQRPKRPRPSGSVPSVKTVLGKLQKGVNQVVWLGHSSYFLWIDDRSYLVDPVFGANAAPVSFIAKAFDGSSVYTANDMPHVDYLLITHDHWDHLDHAAVMALQEKVGRVITGIGTGEHLVHWGYDESQITELDWYEFTPLAQGTTLHATPAKHFSGRGLLRNQTLWLSFVLKTPSATLYLGGDSGYGQHFAEIGKTFGPFDLAVLENGQYNKTWPTTHCTPEQTLRASRDLKAKNLMPVHWGKFQLSTHDWDEPIIRLIKAHRHDDPHLITPVIGEPVGIGSRHTFRSWWKGL